MTTSPLTPVGTIDRLGRIAASNAQLLTNASALVVGTIATSALGFVYWWFAARHFAPEAVGYASAAISLMTLVALIGEFGLGTLLVGEVQRDRINAARLMSTALISSTALTAISAITAVGLFILSGAQLGTTTTTIAGQTLFVIGCAATCFGVVLDQAMVGLLQSSRQMLRNVVFAILKLFFLWVIARMSFGPGQEILIFATWAIAKIASILLLAILSHFHGESIWHRPHFALLRPLIARVTGHHVLNLVTQAPGLALPFLVTILLSASTNSAFYAGWMLLNVAFLVPAALTTVLFTVGTRDPGAFGSRARVTLALSTATAVVAGLGFYLLSDFMLGLFNPAYPEVMAQSLQLMGFSVFGVMIKYHFIALERFRDKMFDASWLLGAGGVLEIVTVIVGAKLGGLYGLATGWTVAVYIQAAIMLPIVVAAAREK